MVTNKFPHRGKEVWSVSGSYGSVISETALVYSKCFKEFELIYPGTRENLKQFT